VTLPDEAGSIVPHASPHLEVALSYRQQNKQRSVNIYFTSLKKKHFVHIQNLIRGHEGKIRPMPGTNQGNDKCPMMFKWGHSPLVCMMKDTTATRYTAAT
jgi:hypothetical protein